MKVAIVGSGVVSIPPKFGGATELIIYEISRYMPKHGIETTVFDVKQSHNKNFENIGGARYVRMGVPRFGNIFLMRLSEFLFGLKAFKKLRKGTDVVHTHTVFTALPFAIFKSLFKGKLVYTCHNPAWSDEDSGVLNKIIMKVEGYIMRSCDHVTTVSDYMRSKIIMNADVPKLKITRIYNFVDTKRFKPKRKKPGKKIFFTSKLSPNKGVEYLILSARIVRDSIPDVRYVVSGPVSFEFEDKNKWKDLVKRLGLENTVIFTGAIPDDRLPDAYAQSDIFCFPTLKESFGIVNVEAMASGLPVITSGIPVVMEVVGDAGIFVTPRDHVALARETIVLLRNRTKMQSMSRKSLARAKAFEKWKVMDEYKNVYTRIARSMAVQEKKRDTNSCTP